MPLVLQAFGSSLKFFIALNFWLVAEYFSGFGQEIGGVNGLGIIVATAAWLADFHVFRLGLGGNHDDRERTRGVTLTSPSYRIETIHLRHKDVHQSEVRLHFECFIYAFHAILRVD